MNFQKLLKDFYRNSKKFLNPEIEKLLIFLVLSVLFILSVFKIGSVSDSFAWIYTLIFVILNPFWLLMVKNGSTSTPVLVSIYNFVMLIIFPVYWYFLSSIITRIWKEKDGEESKGEEEYVELGESKSFDYSYEK